MAARRLVVAAGLVGALALTACIEPGLTPCGDQLCPIATTCVANAVCATAEDLVACTGLDDGDTCMMGNQVGLCDRGLCAVAACGDGVVDASERCDDGNTVSGDGCRADCGKIEACGDLVIDEGEQCDDGNTNPADGCDACVTNAWTAAAVIGGGANTATAGLSLPQAVAVDRHGNVYICDTSNDRVRRLDQNGVITTFAGTGVAGFTGDGGLAVKARVSSPSGVAVDDLGNIYFSDRGNHRIRRVDPNGIITTIAGSGASTFGGDNGPALAAGLDPFGIAVDGLGNLYVADFGHSRIRRVDGATNIITTIAGTSSSSYNGDGIAATTANLGAPAGVAIDGEVIYIADAYHFRVRKIDALGVITTFAGTGFYGNAVDGGPAASGDLNEPWAVAVDGQGDVYIGDTENARIRRVGADGIMWTIAGAGFPNGFSGDGGLATSARLNLPRGVAVDSTGAVYIADAANNRVRRVANSTITTVAGTGFTGFSGNGGAATSAAIVGVGGVAFDAAGNLYMVDTAASLVRRIDPAGVITTIAGTGVAGFSGDDGPATSAQLYFPQDVATDGAGNVYIADTINQRIRRVAVDGTIATVAGNGVPGFSGDGLSATSASLYYPQGIDVDPLGNLYIADTNNNRVRQVVAGTITTIAGTGTGGATGDGQLATTATLNTPTGVAFDADSNVYILDRGNNRIRQIDATSLVISTVLGDGSSAILSSPQAFDIDANGTLFIADSQNFRILRVDAAGTTTLAGAGAGQRNGDGGPAISAILQYPNGIAVRAGNVYVSDTGFVRRVDATGQIIAVVGATDPEGMGPVAQARLADPRALVLGGPFPLIAGGITGTLQGVRDERVEVVAGRYPQQPAIATLARFRDVDFGTIEGIAYDTTLGLIYLSESSAHRLFAVTPIDPADPNTWTIAPLANGAGLAGFSDGAAAAATFRTPSGLYLDTLERKLYVADPGNHAIRMIDLGAGLAGATVTTVAGVPERRGFSGDGGPATAAQLYAPQAIVRCANGDLFIADTGNHRVRRVAAGTNTISTVLGDGVAASSGEGVPASAFPVNGPLGVACDAESNVFVTSTTSVRLLLADESHHVDGKGEVQTIYGKTPRIDFPARVTSCLTGVAIVDATRVQVADSCSGILVELHRQFTNDATP